MEDGTDRSPGTAQEVPPTVARPTFSAPQASLSQTTYTVSIQSPPAATLTPEGDARADIEEPPKQAPNNPDLDESKIESAVLPGVNQDTSNMGELLKPGPPANPKEPSAAPAVTVNKPLPGQNQADPIIGELAPLPVPSPPPPPPTLVNSPASLPSLSSTPTPQSTKSSTVPPESSRSAETSLAITPGTFVLSPLTSFVTITRSTQGKGEASITTALTGTFPTPAAITGILPTNGANPQAIAAAQSITSIVSSTTVIVTASLTPIIQPSGQQDGSILHPTARTLLILFVILGALSILVAIVICMMIRSHKRRSRAQKQAFVDQRPYDASSGRVGVNTHISANPNDNPFLTASEKAIVDRAVLPDGASDLHNASIFSDAITSFINKSRRLTYKISP
ncbi:uncharacterized protein EKO05_0008174 [Ascochyta rabiei]|uniref:Uncharacterized protein n=1 Tax=Didymella rabiei TaxID=5454 RepID=A0A163DAQ5_DIDRA|nr:uncharacterized protein EKO05_0008174 [Ascochyta rabiei]KZM23034.1 hypothetical protein ST47_g5852 [Ascochyta rabiei]UPX17847.1 hypothetical protein EKO05_0008174 [Ascochyta rabiei]